MLDIYLGGGTADKEKFIFDNIDPHDKTIIIVPNQFSLQAERDAFRFMETESLTELMIVDFSVLGHKIVREVEGREPEIIDKYGRHMLLSVILDELGDELGAYGRAKARNSFVDHMNTMISELKRYEISPDMLEEICLELRSRQEDGEMSQAYLSMKLDDILRVYRAYEDAIGDVYRDAEDYITYYAERIQDSELVRDADVWIYGFDTFTPKHLMVIEQLLVRAGSVSVVLTGEIGSAEFGSAQESRAEAALKGLTLNSGTGLFDLTEMVCERLEEIADKHGLEHRRLPIVERRATIWDMSEDQRRQHISLARTSDHHHEAERAAAYIRKLVMEEGCRYGDIAVVCNDSEGLGTMLARALARMDIPVFADRRRHVLHQPVVSFLLSFLDVIQRGYQGDSIMTMVKSGLLGWTAAQESLLENYVREFRIRSGKWREPFTYRADQYSETELEELNRMRAYIVETCDRARESIGRRNTAAEKIRGLYDYLQNDFDIMARIDDMIRRQSEMGMHEGAAETAQIWNAVCSIFEQIVRVIGSRKISNRTLADMIREGLTSLEIGLIPASVDSVMIGTLQRTRPGQIRVLLIIGAEEGLLPLHGQDDGLLTGRELEILEEMDLELARKKAISSREEQIAIYRMCSLPEDRLYVSYSSTGAGQTAARASSLFTGLSEYAGEMMADLEKDDMMESVIDPRMTVSYLAQALRDPKKADRRWLQVRNWYEANDPQSLRRMERAGRFSSRIERLDSEMAAALYAADAKAMNVSASRLEKFSGCPFAHFISYGLVPREQRLFEVGGREIGDIYHRCIMEYCETLTAEEARPDAPGWTGITREGCAERIDRIMDSNESGYRGGVFGSDEDSRFRMERIREICADIAWAITCQVRKGRIRSMRFEEAFGRKSRLPATEFDIDGRKFRLTGKIDRVDMMDASVRIIDYKTGANDIDPDEIRGGYQLQLAVYMDAARQAGETDPAGIFYFRIREFTADVDDPKKMDPEEFERQMRKAYRLEGIAVKDPQILKEMDEDLVSGDKYESTVVPVKYDPKKEDFVSTSGGSLMTAEEFAALLDESRKQAERICRELLEGEISIRPHSTGKKDRDGEEVTACRYCGFSSICRI